MASHPKKLGKYEIVEVLGEGAMGVVYRGFDPGIQRVVALKTIRVLHDDAEGAAMLAARFRNEAQAAGRLNHSGIVNVYDYGHDESAGSTAYIAMEYVEGQTLAHYLSHKVRFKDEDIVGLMSQLLDALHHAHEGGVWHRDVKPANIILAKNGRLKVADFGIARVESSNLTQVHTMLGTPAYMAPEQFTGEHPIDRRVDVYAAGVMLYVLLTNRPPFSGTPEQLMYKVVHESPLAPSQLNSMHRPRFYDDLLARAMAKEPDERFATALEFKLALERAVGEPVDTTIWERTIIGVPITKPPPDPARSTGTAPTGTNAPARATGSASWTQPPTNWDRSQLAAAESTLARFVGPLAGVMVRRAAKECADLPALYAKLAEQVTDPGAKAAFASHLHALQSPAARSGGTLPPPSQAGQPTHATVVPAQRPAFSEAFLDGAKKLMLTQVGPIAGVLVKKAAASAASRDAFIEALAEAVPDVSARKGLREALAKLG